MVVKLLCNIALLSLCISGYGAVSHAQQIKFNYGIGYYIVSDGQARFLYYTTNIAKSFDAERLIKVSPRSEVYVYGLDFSGGHAMRTQMTMGQAEAVAVPMPPHLLGLGAYILRPGGVLDGTYAVGFVPQPGYAEKVYKLHFPHQVDLLRDGKTPYEYVGLQVDPSGGGRGYLIRFNEEDPEIAQTVKRFSEMLRKGATIKGQMTISRKAFLGGNETIEQAVEMQIYALISTNGRFKSELKSKGLNVMFDGSTNNERSISLVGTSSRDTDRLGVGPKPRLDLFLNGDGVLSGSMENHDYGVYWNAHFELKLNSE